MLPRQNSPAPPRKEDAVTSALQGKRQSFVQDGEAHAPDERDRKVFDKALARHLRSAPLRVNLLACPISASRGRALSILGNARRVPRRSLVFRTN